MYVCPPQSAASHIGITKERYQRLHRNRNYLKFCQFCQKCFAQKLWHDLPPRAAPASQHCFFHETSPCASPGAYSQALTKQTTDLWKTACDSPMQTRKRHKHMDHEHQLPRKTAHIRNINRCTIHNKCTCGPTRAAAVWACELRQ